MLVGSSKLKRNQFLQGQVYWSMKTDYDDA